MPDIILLLPFANPKAQSITSNDLFHFYHILYLFVVVNEH